MNVTDIKNPLQQKRLRRMALAAQGLLQFQAFGHGSVGAIQAIKHIGYVQLDTISVVERAHHHVLHSRVPGFIPSMMDELMSAKAVFEYWSHAAAVLPMDDFRYSLPYKQSIKSGQTHWFKNPDKKLMAELLARIHSDGPLRSRDIVTKSNTNNGWWDWKPAKKALEQLYMQGDLMVSERIGFQKTYDLMERVLPSDVDTRMPSVEELAKHLLSQQLRCHGLVSMKGLTYLRRNAELKLVMKGMVDEQLANGYLQSVQLPNNEVYIIETGVLDRSLPRPNKQLKILSPFDNSVIQRERLRNLFGFDYQIECYVPAAKRQYGYFSLPLLYLDEFIGRMDCKAHRKDRHLEIKSLHLEADVEKKLNFDPELFSKAFVSAVESFRIFQQCNTVSLTHVKPKQWSQVLRLALKSLA